MRRFVTQVFAIVVVAGIVLTSQRSVRGDLILGLQTASPLTVNNGDTVFVDLVISDSDNSSPLAAEGLQAGGGRILHAAGSASAAVGAITDTMGYWTGGLFDTNPLSSGAGTEVGKVSTLLDFAAIAGAGAGSTSITIARFAFQITGAAGSTVQLMADRLNLAPQVANTTFGPLAEDLDDNFTGFGSLTFTLSGAAVPEPASMVLGGITLVIAGGGQYLRRRKAKAANTTIA